MLSSEDIRSMCTSLFNKLPTRGKGARVDIPQQSAGKMPAVVAHTRLVE
jgi:hypothetical protein